LCDRPLGRGGRAPGQLWQVPTFVAGLLALVAVTVGTGFRHAPAAFQFARELNALRGALQQPRTPPEPLLPAAEHLLTVARTDFPQRAPEAHFLLGLVRARLAERAPPDRSRDEQQQARSHLEQAEAHGVPPEDLPRLHYYLGKLLLQSGGDLPRAIEYLSRSTARGAEDPAEGYGLLTQAYLRLQPPDVEAALRANELQLEKADDEAVLGAARLLRAELLVGHRDWANALKHLKHVGPGSPPGVRRQARYLQARCTQELKLFGEAVKLWKALLDEPSAVPGGKAHILYALGQCHANDDPRADAAAEARWGEAAALGGAYGQAAALRLAELALRRAEQRGPDKGAGAALHWFRTALDKVNSREAYKNPVVSLDEARALFEVGCRTYREALDHERAGALAELYRKIALPGVAEEHIARAAEARAVALANQAGAGTGPEAAAVREQARKGYREAGAAYEQSAATYAGGEKALRLRRAAACYLRAEGRADRVQAVALLQQFLDLTKVPEQIAEGWFALAGTFRALGEGDQARRAYYACIQYPKSRQAIQARLELAELEVEQSNLTAAEGILLEILGLAGASADRQAQEQSLFRLAELYYQQHQWEKAAYRLSDAVRQFPHNRGVLTARDRLGDCYRKLAEVARKEGPGQATDNPQPSIYRSVRWENLEKARALYDDLADDLEKHSAVAKLSPAEDLLWRKAQFAAADCLFELPNSFSEAVRRYARLAERYPGRMEMLWACQRLLHCFSLLSSDLGQAREVVEEARKAARAALQNVTDPQRMPDEAFQVHGNEKYVEGQAQPVGWISREEWRGWLTGVLQTLDAIPSRPAPAPGR
jgi:tetratricopeptide (TPR) repeat protein